MTQSKKSDDTITLDVGDYTINLDATVGTTTTYLANDRITDVVYSGTNDDSFIVDMNEHTVSFEDLYWGNNNKIDPDEVSKMCKEYPGLEKVWRNFKSVYDMVKQDYEGKKKAGEIDDDFPF